MNSSHSRTLSIVARATGAAILIASATATADASSALGSGRVMQSTVAAGHPCAGLQRVRQAEGLRRGHPANCTNSVWASDLGDALVNGYTTAGALCTSLNGASSGTPFHAPFGLATDQVGNLYVADVDNSRVVVFNPAGGYLATLNMQPNEQPYSVCVSRTGVVGVADRPSSSNGTGDVEFFTNYTVSSMTGNASGVVNTFEWCAFDRNGNFFTDGGNYGGGNQKIMYLRRNRVNLPNQTVLDSGLGSATYWLGMYVQTGFTQLSVGGNYEIQNFAINAATGKPHGVPTITTLAGYPVGGDALYQPAPSAGGRHGTIYIADYGAALVLEAPVGGAGRPGGPVSTFLGLNTTVGIATYPTGQY
jgi:hypothetical protein